ncbi:CPBP family intramembrane glutamic endopeptidase [Lacticaseibacillus yichunensis]|uniref:CPBP family intramembrane glutamic endopeptidase n=1 Tax=Lacticaseibacillus yichunensis TaxID=2486015 RepID=A0ABW4CLR8_9LACO|nr:type II CAAX endopeptidase family protein [Lacticaseibacillus yichunensis]
MSVKTIVRRVFTLVVMFLAYQIGEAFVLVPGLISRGTTPVVYTAILFSAIFGGLIALLWRVYATNHQADQDPFIHRQPFDGKRALLMVGLIVALFAVQALSSVLISHQVASESQNQDLLLQYLAESPLAMTLIVVVGAPPVEELLFRGLLMQAVPHPEKKSWRWLAAGLSAIVFGLAHAGVSDPVNLLVYSAMGFVFASAYTLTGDLRYSIGLHMLNNFAALFLP